MPGGGEVLANDLGEEDACAGPDADAGHRHQDLGKRARRHEFLDLLGDLSALLAQRRELRGQSGQDHAGGVGAGDHDGLRRECREDLLGEPAAAALRMPELRLR